MKLIIAIILLTNCISSQAQELQKPLVKEIVAVEESNIASSLNLETELAYLVQGEDIDLPFSSENSIKVGFIICCDIARPKFSCEIGGGLCNCRIGRKNCADNPGSPIANMQIDFSIVDNTHLKIVFSESLPEDVEDNFYIDEGSNFVDPEIAASLGYTLIEMLVGSYEIVYTEANPFGTVTVEISTEE